MNKYPMADASTSKDKEKEKNSILRVIVSRQLVGAANNTKWNELITAMRAKEGSWLPSYRYKWVEGFISDWDVEWWYHLPFPFIGVEWFDIGLHQKVQSGKRPGKGTVDHTDWILELLNKIGFEHEVSGDVVRIWGYLPKSYEDFPLNDA